MANWIAKIGALDENDDDATLRFSDMAYIDDDGYYYDNRMTQPALIQVSPSDGGVFSVFSSPSIGEIELLNVDGALDYLADYAVDNGVIVLSLIDDAGQKTDYLTGKVESLEWRGDKLYFIIRSMNEVLQRNHPTTKYAGDNVLPAGVEGVASDIKGNIKPKVWGDVKNAQPVFVNTSRLIYQFSDRQTATVSAVYDKGAALTLGTTYTWANFATFQTAAVTAGQFSRCAGYVKLGATPVGTITGDCADSSTLAGDVIEQILTDVSLTLDGTAKTALNGVGSVGIYMASETSSSALIDEIARSCGAYWYFIGDVVHAKLTQLATSSILDLTDSENIAFVRSGTGLGKNGLPIASVVMEYDKIETVQQESELAGSVTADRKAVLSKEYRRSISDPTILAQVYTRHPLAGAIEIKSCLRSESSVTSVTNRLLLLAKNRVDIVQITAIVYEIPAIDLGDGVTVTTSKLGYNDGKLLTIIGFQIDAKKKLITLECIG